MEIKFEARAFWKVTSSYLLNSFFWFILIKLWIESVKPISNKKTYKLPLKTSQTINFSIAHYVSILLPLSEIFLIFRVIEFLKKSYSPITWKAWYMLFSISRIFCHQPIKTKCPHRVSYNSNFLPSSFFINITNHSWIIWHSMIW